MTGLVRKAGVLKRIPLHVNIVGIFFVMLVVLLGVVIAFNYDRNSKAALEAGEAMIGMVGDRIAERVLTLLMPVQAITEASIRVPSVTSNEATFSTDLAAFLKSVLHVQPAVTSVYVGRADGTFDQLYRFNGESDPQKRALKAPVGAKYALRRVEATTGEEEYLFLDKEDRLLELRLNEGAKYDPRERPWYGKAMGVDASVRTSLYAFSASGEIGLTFARRFPETADVKGVTGADITLASLATFLTEQRLSDDDSLVLFDAGGRVIATSSGSAVGQKPNGKLRPLKVNEIASDPFQQLLLEVFDFDQRQEVRFDVNGRTYLGLVTPILEESHEPLYLAMASPMETFTGPIEKTREQSLVVSLLVLTLGFPMILLASRRISRPLQALATEAERIGELDLVDDIPVRSRISEIWTLTIAMNRARTALRNFAPYIPKSLVDELLAAGQEVEIGGDRREIAVMFTDVEKFSDIAEVTSPEDLTKRMSDYFDGFQHEIFETQGVVDKFIGDAVMALWNAPRRITNPAAQVCRAALLCRERVDAFNHQLAAQGFPPFHTRFGLNIGEAVVGNVGSKERMNYTAYGSTVVIASRLEPLNKQYGTWCLLTEDLKQRAGDRFLFRSIDFVLTKGSQHPVRIFELVGAMSAEDGPVVTDDDLDFCRRWEVADQLMRSHQFDAALELFEELCRERSDDRAAQSSLDRCRALAASPPSADWDGVTRYASKA